MARASTCLWFSPEDAPKAVEFYTSVIPGSRIVSTQTFANDQQPTGQVQVWTLEVAGSTVQVMGSGGNQPFTMAHSMWLLVEDQAELDQIWDAFLAAGGKEFACGWIADRFGVHWQIVPAAWERLISGDQARAQRVVEALWQMIRPDIAKLEEAAQG